MKSLKKISLFLVTFLLAVAITSCTGGTGDCKVCADGNNDGKCDVCGKTVCAECVDEDGNGKCDVCKKDIKNPAEDVKDVVLIKDEVAVFQIVLSKNTSNAVKQAVNTKIKAVLKNTYDIKIDVITEGSNDDTEIETEILIGNVSSRGEDYYFDGHTLGKQGYAFKIIGSKVIVNAGSDDQLVAAIEKFADEILIPDDPTDVIMTAEDVIVHQQKGYGITALKVNGTDMRGYTMAVDLTRSGYKEAALSIQDTIYTRTGYWFEIVDIENATEKSFILKNIPKVEGDESFKVSAEGTKLVIECAYDNMLEKATNRFIADNIITAKGEVDFKGDVYKQDISVVYYEDFGAKGDGSTDDYQALYDTHVFANISGQTVKGKPGARYYLFDSNVKVNSLFKISSIPIRTNTDWQGAKIIIDDRKLASYSGGLNSDLAATHIFSVLPNTEHASTKITNSATLDAIVADGLNPDTTHINFELANWDGSMMLIPYNSEHKVFRRKGYGQHSGEDMHEIIIIDKDGNVSEETPIMFEYTNINSMTVYKLDPTTAIRVGNGTIETLETEVNHNILKSDGTYDWKSTYRKRGINVSRSYTTIYNVEHVVTGGITLYERAYENKEGSMANGMFRASYADHVTFENCIIPGRHCYGNSSTYNFGGLCVNKIVLKNCIQSNFWVTVDSETAEQTPSRDYSDGAIPGTSSVSINGKTFKLQWGIGGTNYCKNMEYIDSQISRFDAHAGLYNGKIINTNINGLELTGVGDLIIENVNWYQYGATVPFLYLRSDYGYHWDGHISVKDTNAYLFDLTKTAPTLYIANHKYANWYFGYTCAFPSITLDNFAVYSTKTQKPMTSGYEAQLISGFSTSSQKMHLTGNTDSYAIFDYLDANGDGFIDEPLYDYNRDGKIDELDRIDVDGDGRIGETNIDIKKDLAGKTQDQLESGIKHSTCKRNLNITKPPEFIKIINNNAGIIYRITNTAGKGISDGGWYNETDSMGGFFGGTKFIYGTGEKDYFIGTQKNQKYTKTFAFD